MDAWAKPQAAAVALVLWLLQPLPPLPARGPEPMAANGAVPPAGGAAAAAPDQGGNSAKLRRALAANFSEDHFIIPNMWQVRSNVPGDYEPCQYMPNVLVSEWRDKICGRRRQT